MRVKLYLLSSHSDWEDLGTGHLRFSGQQFTIFDENSDSVLLDYLLSDEVFWRQGDSILLFSTPELKTFAMSFPGKETATAALEQVCKLQNKNVADVIVEEDSPKETEEILELGLDSLPQLAEHLTKLRLSGKCLGSQSAIPPSFLSELGSLFHKAESETSEYLSVFFDISKELIHAGNEPLLRSLLSDDHYLELFGALECKRYTDAPELKGKRADFREFLRQVKFCNVMETTDGEFVALVERNYRLQYLKDTAFARCPDEACAGFLICAQINVWTEVLDHFLQSRDLKRKFVDRLRKMDLDSFELLNEMGSMAKNVVPYLRVEFYEYLYSEGVLKLAAEVFQEEHSPDAAAKIYVYLSDLLICMLTAVPGRGRDFLLSDCPSKSLLSLVAAAFLETTEISPLQTLSDLFKTLLEPAPERRQSDLFTVFYETVIPQFVSALHIASVTEECTRIRVSEILSLLTLCVVSHGYRVRFLVSNFEVLRTCTQLLRLGDKPVTVSVLKLVKAIVQRNDSTLTKLLANEEVLEETWRLFRDNEAKGNMIYSLCLGIAHSVTQADSALLDEGVAQSPAVRSAPKIQAYFRDLLTRHEATLVPPGYSLSRDEPSPNLKRKRDSDQREFEKKAKVESSQ